MIVGLILGAAGQADAQYLCRPLLGDFLSNAGRGSGGVTINVSNRLAYPRHREVGGDEAPPSSQARGNMDNCVGHGFFVLTRRGGGYQTTWSGPRDMPPEFGQNFPMQYNPVTDGPEGPMGTEVFGVRGQNYRIGSWYPGRAPLDPKNPIGLVVENHRFWQYPADDGFPEQVVLNKWTTSQGITFIRKAYGWSYQDFDDFNLHEVEFTNTGDANGDGVRDLPEETLSPVYISVAQWLTTSAGEVDPYVEFFYQMKDRNADDWFIYSDAKNYPADRYGRDGKRIPAGLKLLFHYDDDYPDFPIDDRGGSIYRNFMTVQALNAGILDKDGQFGAFQFMGMAPLAFSSKGPFAFAGRDVGKTFVEPEGDQPSSVRWYRGYDTARQDDPNPKLHTAQQMQTMLQGGVADNPTTIGFFFSAQTYGPYTLPPGATGKLVFAYVAGAGSQMLNQDMMTWAEKANKDELSLGQDAMLQNLEAARFAYRQGYDIPDAPPDVAFETSSSPNAHMQLSWSDATDNASNPDYTGAEAKDITGYRIYRATWLAIGPWTLIGEVKKGTATGGTYTFEDPNSVAGFPYMYSVRAVSAGHPTWTNGKATLVDLPKHIQDHVKAGLEGGWSGPFQKDFQRKSPVQLAKSETDQLSKKVRVVPNPFVLISGDPHRYPGGDKIRFVNIPSKCEIYVYSVSGDLIIKLAHDNPKSAEHDFDFRVWNNATYACSGIYYWVVKSLTQGSEGKIQRGTFYVVK
ncbi:MAG: hypothetical protein A3F84_26150 [Candidatus Handelsmanbacteria bacterium RIFCSPLOWO2_12_FULL_64_10]|uniref:Uncharacterized protein n=1 Tax=Handelsmanbacteria sp. (strain RIFCSPLOWO2_12_FULL_64_10) TaxID=1817868 RepID=A0A1F6CAF7_HANXR|nr:MAG: hypothetical protein A3F84_26150 [Candidatus Handelsmanbacteria bacterium RIFCSPLOWO2_12_FULL_64_10]